MPTKGPEGLSAATLRLFVPNYGPLAGRDVYRRHIVAGERAEAEAIATLIPSQNAKVEDLLLVHTAEYVEALRGGQPADLASTGGEWFPGSVDVSLSVLGALLGAIDWALAHGVAGVLGGGGHHAYSDHGGALSPVNDLAIGVHHLRRRGIGRVLVLDLDAHFGNGTTASFPNDPDLFLFDFHGHASDFWRPDTLHLFKNFRDEPDARLYLQVLRKELPNVLTSSGPKRVSTPRAWTCSQEPRILRCVCACLTSRSGKALCSRHYRAERCRLLTSTLADMRASKL